MSTRLQMLDSKKRVEVRTYGFGEEGNEIGCFGNEVGARGGH